MAHTAVVYPRCFTSVHVGPATVIASRGDLAVDVLYGMLVDRAHNHSSWAFRKQILDAALRLFGNFNDWVDAQRKNPRVAGYNADFVEDTLQYIETGERKMCLENWIELMSEGHPPIHLAGTHSHAAPRLWQSPSTVKTIQKWCQHPNGVNDLLSTLHLLFGRARA